MNKQIIPWKCHCCGGAFDTFHGGLCSKCGQPTCSLCFGIGTIRSLAKWKMPRARICRSCAKAGEQETSSPKS